jgi:phosphoglycolate phosphatase
MIKNVILDFDGTLASTLDGIHLCMNETLLAFGFAEQSPEAIRRTIGLTLQDSLHLLTDGLLNQEEVLPLIEAYRTLYNKKAATVTTLFAGVYDTLDRLRASGRTLILVSNKGRAGLHNLLEALKIRDLLDVILNADDVTYRKPDGRLFAEEIAPLLADRTPSSAIVVGDSEVDIKFAHDAGLNACWASYGYGNPMRCTALQPRYTIEQFEQIIKIVDR